MAWRLQRTALRCIVLAVFGCRLGIADDLPKTYVVDYPAADQFVAPIEGFFDEIATTVGRVGRRTFRHQPNGGYGLAIRNKGHGKNLLHLGADVGWYRVGDPVVAVADGVVRVVQRPELKNYKRATKPAVGMQSGGVVAVEHRLPDDQYVTTVYFHLAPDLMVSVNEAVKVGQPLGTIGNTRVNGGYKPHLHFGIREGRMAEKGRMLAQLNFNGQPATLSIRDVKQNVVVLSGADDLPDRVSISAPGRTFELRKQGSDYETAADILWHLPSPDFAIVGYGLSTDGWLDPTEFLHEQMSKSPPRIR